MRHNSFGTQPRNGAPALVSWYSETASEVQWESWLAGHLAGRRVAITASARLSLTLYAATSEEKAIGIRFLSLQHDLPLAPGVETWWSAWETLFALREWHQAAASKAFLLRAAAEREPTLEETIIGSGWLSHELPNYPQHKWFSGTAGTWDDDGSNVPLPLFPTHDDQPPAGGYPPHVLERWREDYLDFCELVRNCACRRQTLGLPAVDHCSRWDPCGRCRYHPGALLPSPAYWRDLEEVEIDRLIKQREDERQLRDDTILRARARRRAAIDWYQPRSRSRSPYRDVPHAEEEGRGQEDEMQTPPCVTPYGRVHSGFADGLLQSLADLVKYGCDSHGTIDSSM